MLLLSLSKLLKTSYYMKRPHSTKQRTRIYNNILRLESDITTGIFYFVKIGKRKLILQFRNAETYYMIKEHVRYHYNPVQRKQCVRNAAGEQRQKWKIKAI